MTKRKSYRVFNLREMAMASTGEVRRMLLDMVATGWGRVPSVEDVRTNSVFGQILIGLGAKDGEKVVIEE